MYIVVAQNEFGATHFMMGRRGDMGLPVIAHST